MLQIVLDKLALDKEKRDLLRENKQLRAVLKQYLDGKVIDIYIYNQIIAFLYRKLKWKTLKFPCFFEIVKHFVYL